MATSSQITPKSRTRPKNAVPTIVKSRSASGGTEAAGGGWSLLSALFDGARESFGGFYCFVARSALEKKENLEDLRAEQKARRRKAAARAGADSSSANVKNAAISASLRELPKELPAPVSRSKD
jgi:hypothetical protein